MDIASKEQAYLLDTRAGYTDTPRDAQPDDPLRRVIQLHDLDHDGRRPAADVHRDGSAGHAAKRRPRRILAHDHEPRRQGSLRRQLERRVHQCAVRQRHDAGMVMTTTSRRADQPSRIRESRHAGFTLVELVVAVSIVGILAALAAPAFRELIAGQRVQTAASELYTGFVRARSEALKQNVDVTISSTAGSTNWAAGWKVKVGSTTLDDRGAGSRVTVTGSATTLTYRTSGRLTAGSVPTFEITATDTATVRCIKVNLSGQPYVLNTACSMIVNANGAMPRPRAATSCSRH